MDYIYEPLADILEYPGDDWRARLELCRERMKGGSPELARPFDEFCRSVESLSLAELQELYTFTFDLNPVCALEVGYHLFGEDYKRGIFLANLRETEAPYDLGQDRQLPDYLPVLLRLVVKLEDAELRSDLVSECLIPAIEKMAAALAGSRSIYSELIATLGEVLKREAPERSGRAPLSLKCGPEVESPEGVFKPRRGEISLAQGVSPGNIPLVRIEPRRGERIYRPFRA
jgi:nitrate reductase delta subunit